MSELKAPVITFDSSDLSKLPPSWKHAYEEFVKSDDSGLVGTGPSIVVLQFPDLKPVTEIVVAGVSYKLESANKETGVVVFTPSVPEPAVIKVPASFSTEFIAKIGETDTLIAKKKAELLEAEGKGDRAAIGKLYVELRKLIKEAETAPPASVDDRIVSVEEKIFLKKGLNVIRGVTLWVDTPNKPARLVTVREVPRGVAKLPPKPVASLKWTGSFSDNTGFVYWLGTEGGKRSYENPADNGKVSISMSTSGGSSSSHLFDRDCRSYAVENSYGSSGLPWLEVSFGTHGIRPTGYFVAQDGDHYLRNWTMEGYNPKTEAWVLLDEHKSDETLTSGHQDHYFPVKSRLFFQRFRLSLTGPSHAGSNNYDISQMEFFGDVAPAVSDDD